MGKQYSARIDFIDGNSVVIGLDGEFTDDLEVGRVNKMSDEIYLKILDVQKRGIPGYIGNATFQLYLLNEDVDLCNNGCELDNNCVQVGYRHSGEYCSNSGRFVSQLKDSESCENDFECEGNVCVSGQCIESGFIQKIINWFRELIG